MKEHPPGAPSYTPEEYVREADAPEEAGDSRGSYPFLKSRYRYTDHGRQGHKGGPEEVCWVAERHLPDGKIVIPQWGVRCAYPTQAYIGKMKYDDRFKRYRPEDSWEYGQPAIDAVKKRGEFMSY